MRLRLGSARRSARTPRRSAAAVDGHSWSGERYAMEVVTGATGYIGGRLGERLLADGREVRALARNPAKLPDAPFDVMQGDVIAGTGLERALDGCETAYYLIHSMEHGASRNGNPGGFADRDRRAADNFARAAQTAGIDRIVYLGGLMPAGAQSSPHLLSRLE